MKLGQTESDAIMTAIRAALPAGVRVRRRASGNLVIKYKSDRFSWHSSSANTFGHISRRNSRAGALAIGYRETLHMVNRFLTRAELRWPGLAWGPVEVSVHTVSDHVLAHLKDVEGTVIDLPELSASGAAHSELSGG